MKIDTVLQILLLLAAIFCICRQIRAAVCAALAPRCVTLSVVFDGSLDEGALLCLVGRLRRVRCLGRRSISVILTDGREISEQGRDVLKRKGIKIYCCGGERGENGQLFGERPIWDDTH